MKLTITQLQEFKQIRYLPRDAVYNVLHHAILVKGSDDEWVEGMIYQDTKSGAIYSRAYCTLSLDNWCDGDSLYDPNEQDYIIPM